MYSEGLLVVLSCLLLQTVPVWSRDCSENLRRIQKRFVVKETDPNGTLFLEFENSYTKVDWFASVNGTHKDVISGYLQTENRGDHFRLVLAKSIDLEFISTDLNMEIGDDGLQINIVLWCLESFGEQSQVSVILEVVPVNEFFPAFIRAPYVINVKENTPIGSQVFTFEGRVQDTDVGSHRFSFKITPYMISEFDGHGLFEINHETGSVVIATELDFEQLPRNGRNYYFINVTVTDEGNFAQSTSVKITVEDVNDLGIEFIYPGCNQRCSAKNVSYFAETNESYIGDITLSPADLKARDLDTLQTRIEYFLVSESIGEYFHINRDTGDLSKTAPLINDSFGFEIDIEVFLCEESDAKHNLTAHIKVFISERRPTTGS